MLGPNKVSSIIEMCPFIQWLKVMILSVLYLEVSLYLVCSLAISTAVGTTR